MSLRKCTQLTIRKGTLEPASQIRAKHGNFGVIPAEGQLKGWVDEVKGILMDEKIKVRQRSWRTTLLEKMRLGEAIKARK